MKRYFLVFLLHSFISGSVLGVSIKTPHYTWDEQDELVLALIEHPKFQRLKHIEQHGIWSYLDTWEQKYNRYEHSLGVYALLKRYNAPRIEQIAGLLHDVSHTVFSHVGDKIFGSLDPNHDAYQDIVHSQFLEDTGIAAVLRDHGLEPEQVDPKSGEFPMLECDLPDLCADRIDYIIQGGLQSYYLSQPSVEFILDHLHYSKTNNRWYFDDIHAATMFSNVSLVMTENTWGSPSGTIAEYFLARALKACVDLKELKLQDIKHGKDLHAWQTIMKSTSQDAITLRNLITNPNNVYQLLDTPHESHQSFARKFRGVNPFIQNGTAQFIRLTKVARVYREEFEKKKAISDKGIHVRYL